MDEKPAVLIAVGTPTLCELSANIDGRQTLAALTRIVGELQREEVPRTRLGMSR